MSTVNLKFREKLIYMLFLGIMLMFNNQGMHSAQFVSAEVKKEFFSSPKILTGTKKKKKKKKKKSLF